MNDSIELTLHIPAELYAQWSRRGTDTPETLKHDLIALLKKELLRQKTCEARTRVGSKEANSPTDPAREMPWARRWSDKQMRRQVHAVRTATNYHSKTRRDEKREGLSFWPPL